MPNAQAPLLTALLGGALLVAAPACEPVERPASRPRINEEPGMAEARPRARPAAGTEAAAPAAAAALEVAGIALEPDPPLAVEDVRAEVTWKGIANPSMLDVSFEWTVNDRRVYGHTRENLPAGNYRRGDRIGVKVSGVAPDGRKAEASRAGIEVANASPRITQDFTHVRTFHGLTVEAEDPDGDPLTFSLESPPPGFSIDPKTGRIRVVRGPYPGGVYPMKVHAKDPHGGDAVAEVSISMTVGEEPKVGKAEVEKVRRVKDMTDAEHEKSYGKLVDRVMDMDDAQIDQLEKDQEKREAGYR